MVNAARQVVLMLTKLDWISFSVPMDTTRMEDDRDAPAQFIVALDNLHPDLAEWLGLATEFEARNGRAPYSTSFSRMDDGLRIFVNHKVGHALCEISGKGCDALIAEGTENAVLAAVQNRVTRIDVACDILTEERPKAWAEDRELGRFKATSYVISESGETFYVGAKTSDRYARVYRYNHPHERAAFLRVEYVIKAENAKIMAHAILEERLSSVVAALWSSFGWNRGKDCLDATPAEIALYRPDRKQGKTLFWLNDTVAPLLARLHSDGVLSIDQWLAEVVKPLIKN